MTEKRIPLLQLLTVTLFIGLLLSFALFYLIHTALGYDNDQTPYCMDGTVIPDGELFSKLDRAVYQNTDLQSSIRNKQFLLFGAIAHQSVIGGDNNFLFEIETEDGRYNYLEDYLGLCSFTDAEYAAIAALLQRRVDYYAENGAQYLLVVLPNSQTVYGENLPSYLGTGGTTRLEGLTLYLQQNGFVNYLDLSEALTSYKSQGPLYNNTENSLNSLGIYYAYLSVCNYLRSDLSQSTYVLPRASLSFYQHMTTGKAAARRAGLSDVVDNLTVSLSNNMLRNYDTVFSQGNAAQTCLTGEDLPLGISLTPSLLLQFSDTWERLQAEPFFSNSFQKVTYQTNWVSDASVFEQAQPDVVVQFLYEYQLSWLLPLTFPS